MSVVVLVQLLKNDQASQNIFYGFQNPINDNSLIYLEQLSGGTETGRDIYKEHLSKKHHFSFTDVR
jgi:hypothetical protein